MLCPFGDLSQDEVHLQLMASTERHSLLPIHLDITFPHLPCARRSPSPATACTRRVGSVAAEFHAG